MTARTEGPSVDIDEGRLSEMLALVGPACEQHLMRSLICDLRAARARLLRAAARRDTPGMRDQTHVLASLAGTFGAEALNAAAQELEARSLSSTGAVDASRVIHRTDRLITDLSGRLAERAR
jgi:HPt (histidine-containing phosphotransfer) domain-containing protein